MAKPPLAAWFSKKKPMGSRDVIGDALGEVSLVSPPTVITQNLNLVAPFM